MIISHWEGLYKLIINYPLTSQEQLPTWPTMLKYQHKNIEILNISPSFPDTILNIYVDVVQLLFNKKW